VGEAGAGVRHRILDQVGALETQGTGDPMLNQIDKRSCGDLLAIIPAMM
jgi:hypothetical protein